MTTLNLDNFSPNAYDILKRGETLARKRRHRSVEPVHVLISALMHKDTSGVEVLKGANADPDALLARLSDELGLLPKAYRDLDQVYVSQAVIEAVNEARRHAQGGEVQIGHVLAGLAGLRRGAVGRLMRQQGATPEAVLGAMGSSSGGLSSGGVSGAEPGAVGGGARRGRKPQGPLKIDELKKVGTDLTAQAEQDAFDPVIGREAELRRVMQVLSRRTKNNPVLIGEPGVGKASIVRALAQRIVAGDVPEGLKDTRVFTLEMGKLVAGTSLRGQFEERLQKIMDEIRDSGGRVVVFIDEIHNMVGSSGQEGGNNAAGLLKPYLARGEVRCIGTTTAEDYKQYIEEDKALVRRFQEVQIDEPTADQAVAILRGIKHKFEIHHGVRITDAAVVAAVKISDRYMTDRRLPDKAIDLIDEAASLLRLEIDSKPGAIDSVERRIRSLEIERGALEGENTQDARDEIKRLDDEIAGLSAEVAEMSRRWKDEKATLDRVTQLQEELDATVKLLEKAKRDNDLGRVSELKRFVIPSLERDIEAANARVSGGGGERLLKQDVDPGDIADVVSSLTGIPVNKMMEGDRSKLLKMEDRLRQRVVGQDEAIASIATAVRRSRAGVSDPNKPIGNFFFVGPTGVGKTELAKALAEFLFDTEDALIRIDMSEYQEQAKVNTLIGSARGYVGSEKGGILTEAVRRKPYSVVLFDEAEKAHPKVFDLLLQVMDEGRLTDSQGLEVDFTNTIVIMTSNVGSRRILEETGKISNEALSELVHGILRDHFRPEFLNRIDKIVAFGALNDVAIDKILEIQLRKLNRILAEQKLTIELTQKAKDWVAEEGYIPEYGARPVKRAVLNHIQDPLAMHILEGDFTAGDVIHADVDEDDEGLVFARAGDLPDQETNVDLGDDDDAPEAPKKASPFEDI